MAASETVYRAIVIGSGQGGTPLARSLAGAGRKTALVERQHVGGSCINDGCTPTKTMVASARVAYLAGRAADYGVHVGPVRVDLAEVRRRKQGVVDRFREGSVRRLTGTPGVDLLMGEARFVGPRSLEVAGLDGQTRRISADQVIINTGCRPAHPALPGLAEVPVLDSTSIMELETIPEHLIVLGGGYVGLEFGQMFRRFGSRVTIVQRGPQLLSREDADVATGVAEILAGDGIELLMDTPAISAARGSSGSGAIRLTVRGPNGERTLEGSHLLAATGRVPNTERLGLAAAGVATNQAGFIEVNPRLETSAAGVFAIGDVKGGPAFTHISYDDYRILAANLVDGRSRSTEGRLVPYTVYIDPQLGRVGLTESEARKGGRAIKVARLPCKSIARAIEMGETRGFIKAVVDAATEQILGCAMLGIEGGELMSLIEVAMMGRVPCSALRDGIFAHPTLAESLNNLFQTWV